MSVSSDDEEEDPSAFLESFPTYRLHSEPRPGFDGLWVFSSKDERYENNSYSSDDAGTRTMIYDEIVSAFSKICNKDEGYENNSYSSDDGTRMMIHEKIVSAFSKICNDFYGLIAQFWAPVTIGGKLQLSTFGQPFAVSILHKDFIEYRRRCVEEYGYDIDVNSKFKGTPTSAFLNRFPEIIFMPTSVHHEVDSLLRYASQKCNLNSSVMIPICCPSQTSSSSGCIGVIQCSSWHTHLELFKEMNMKIKEVGLSVYNVQDRIPYKTINGLELARGQIQKALKIVCRSHHINLAQVWIASLDENHVHFSSSSEEAQTRLPLGLKLTGYNSIDEDSARIARNCNFCQNYYDACDLISLKLGPEFVLKTLQDYEPRFCKNISKLDIHLIIGWDWYAAADGSMSLTICMRSIHTGDFNYVFEFLWKHDSFNPSLLEEILLEVKRCLPSFKFASGTEIGYKLHVIEVDNSIGKEIKKFDIFQLKRLSPIPEALKEGKKQVAVDYIVPLDTNYKTSPILVPQQVIEQQFGTSTTEDFLAAQNILGVGDLMDDRDDERLSEAMNKGKKAILINYNARSKVKRDTTEIELSREDIELHYGKTMKKAAEELGVSLSTLKRKHNKLGMPGWQGPDLPQRKAYNSNRNQSKESHTHEKDNGVIQDPSPVKRNENTVIKAEYADDIIKIHLSVSEATIVTVENEIGKKFKLKNGSFHIKYLDEDEEWILMTSDQDLRDCVQNSRRVDRSAARLRVLLHNQ